MMELRDLYQEVILDHNQNPRNHYAMEIADRQANGHNPLCGDKLSVYLQITPAGIIEKVSFVGEGCAISTASASLMTEILRGKSIREAEQLFQTFHQALLEDKQPAADDLGKLSVLLGVKEFPIRVKCATLAWHTLQAALQNQTQDVTTE